MPEFDLRGMKAAKYNYDKSQKKITYGEAMSMGEAMTANLEMKFAEGRIYAESSLSEYMKKGSTPRPSRFLTPTTEDRMCILVRK